MKRFMNKHYAIRLSLIAFAMALFGLPTTAAETAEDKAVAFLTREVPAWPRQNGCFSCHNNGDAMRALYAAAQRGYRVPAEALAATTTWLSAPAGWDENKGDPGFSDKRLADVQFASALLAAYETGFVKTRAPLEQAARKVMTSQTPDGTWPIDTGSTLGSPATYGTPLATWMALRVLKAAALNETDAAVRKAENWLRQLAPTNVMNAAVLRLALARDASATAKQKREQAWQLIRRAQTRDGGWGPYADAPPEVFDTALVLLALAEAPPTNSKAIIQRGRRFLLAQQTSEGNWAATTRPSGGDSYAQMMSTTGWAALALLATK